MQGLIISITIAGAGLVATASAFLATRGLRVSAPPAPIGKASVLTRKELAACPRWREALAGQRKDRRYYEIVDDTLVQGFDYRYFALEDAAGRVRAVQPAFLLNQDLLAGVGPRMQALIRQLRRLFPRALTMRTLMVGCAAGEGHLDDGSPEEHEWIARSLQIAVHRHARSAKAGLIVLKEFPSRYRRALLHFSGSGYTRVPSLPMTRLNIDYPDFETYMTRALSKVTRKNLRRKFKMTVAAEAIGMEVVEDLAPFLDEAYPLYLQVFGRSKLQFEKLTPEYLRRLGQEMPDKARFFLWRQSGRLIAFSVCLIHGDTLYDEYLGLDYSVALNLHLYHYTLRDVLNWSMARGLKWYVSSALNYDPKLHLKSELAPLDLYVTHTNPVFNFVLRRLLPWLEPTRGDKILQQFPNYADVWGDA